MIKDTNRDCPVSGLPDQKAGIEVCLEDDRWPQALKHPERLAIQAIELTIRYFEETNTDPKRLAELSAARQNLSTMINLTIVLMNDADIQSLNSDYRGKDGPTNVLSFRTPMSLPSLNSSADCQEEKAEAHPIADMDEGLGHDQPPELWAGDIFLAFETIAKEAEDQSKSLKDHATHLIIHGFLHLIGYDHQDKSSAAIMESLEIDLLERLGLQNPYKPVQPLKQNFGNRTE